MEEQAGAFHPLHLVACPVRSQDLRSSHVHKRRIGTHRRPLDAFVRRARQSEEKGVGHPRSPWVPFMGGVACGHRSTYVASIAHTRVKVRSRGMRTCLFFDGLGTVSTSSADLGGRSASRAWKRHSNHTKESVCWPAGKRSVHTWGRAHKDRAFCAAGKLGLYGRTHQEAEEDQEDELGAQCLPAEAGLWERGKGACVRICCVIP
jgi:hypothetical protein